MFYFNYEEDVSPDASGVRGRKEEDVVTEPKLKKSHLLITFFWTAGREALTTSTKK